MIWKWIEHALAVWGLFWVAVIIGMTIDERFIQPRKKPQPEPTQNAIRDYLRRKPIADIVSRYKTHIESEDRRIVQDMHIALKNHFRYLNGKKMR